MKRILFLCLLGVLTLSGPVTAVSQSGRPFHLSLHVSVHDFPITYAVATTAYNNVNAYGDLNTHQFNDGVPWVEIGNRQPWHQNVMSELQTRLTNSQHEFYIAASPLNSDRSGLNLYWGSGPSMPLPAPWSGYELDDPEVIDAYIAYCIGLINHFNPKYFAYAVEPNMMIDNNPQDFPKLMVLLEKTYTTLKAKFPELPVFLTIQIDFLAMNPQAQTANVQDMLQYSDYVAVSTYPYLLPVLNGVFSAGNVPADWFSAVADLAPDKPFAVAETGYAAQRYYSQAYSFTVPGSNHDQREYVEFMLQQAYELNAKFISYLFYRDIDNFLNNGLAAGALPQSLIDELSLFKDIGLENEFGTGRLAKTVWTETLSTSYAPPEE